MFWTGINSFYLITEAVSVMQYCDEILLVLLKNKINKRNANDHLPPEGQMAFWKVWETPNESFLLENLYNKV